MDSGQQEQRHGQEEASELWMRGAAHVVIGDNESVPLPRVAEDGREQALVRAGRLAVHRVICGASQPALRSFLPTSGLRLSCRSVLPQGCPQDCSSRIPIRHNAAKKIGRGRCALTAAHDVAALCLCDARLESDHVSLPHVARVEDSVEGLAGGRDVLDVVRPEVGGGDRVRNSSRSE